eukprot:2144131-Pyramimonas_sp.AAC.1
MPGVSPRHHDQLLRPLEAEAFPLGQLAPALGTCNVSGWGSGQLWLQNTGADVAVMQGYKQMPHQLASASSWARRHGWKSPCVADVAGDGGGPSAGVA